MHYGAPEDDWYVVISACEHPAPVLFEGTYNECFDFMESHLNEAFSESWTIERSDEYNSIVAGSDDESV